MKIEVSTTMVLLAALISLSGCSKDENVDPVIPAGGEFFNCRIIQGSREGFAIKTYKYDDQGRITEFVNASSTFESTYSGNQQVINVYYAGDLSRVETVTLNDAGFAIVVEKDHQVASLDDERTTYEYNNQNQLLKRTVAYDGRTSETITVYQWVEGNLVAESRPDLTRMTKYTYTDKPDQPATWFSLNNTERGYKLIANKNRPASLIQEDGDVFTYSYNTKEDGLIESITTTTPDRSYTETFLYECD